MSGLSQLELDALCSVDEAPASEPSSPLGNALLMRKRQRQRQWQLQAATSSDEVNTCPSESAERCELGLTQAALDEMCVVAEPTEDPIVSSPVGSALRSVKNRRRWGVPAVAQDEKMLVQNAMEEERAAIAETLTAHTEPQPVLHLGCPASWGTGISQTELDALCGDAEETPTSPSSSRMPSKSTVCGDLQLERSPSKKEACSPKTSPRRRKRLGNTRKEDFASNENCGGKEPAIWDSPAKTMDSPSPCKSPQRRPRSIITPLSPVELN